MKKFILIWVVALLSYQYIAPHPSVTLRAINQDSSQTEEAFPEEAFYDEVYNPDGTVRAKYREALEWVKSLTKKEYEAWIAKSKKILSGDTPMAPLPQIVTESEAKLIQAGTEQRAKAIVAFLNDHYSGKATYRDKVVPGKIIDQIIGRTGEGPLFPMIQKNHLGRFRFLYGPDLIRGKDGQYYVLEDNLGFVGGTPGDTIPAREAFDALAPEVREKLPITNDPKDFLAATLDNLAESASPKIGHFSKDGVIVMLATPPYGDKEDVRMAQELAKRGVILVTPNTRNKKLNVREDGVFLEERSKYGGKPYERKVGMLWLNSEHAWADPRNPHIYLKSLMDEARSYLDEKDTSEESKELIRKALEPDTESGKVDPQKLETVLKKVSHQDFMYEDSVLTSKGPNPGLVEAILDGRVQSNYTPGVEFIGDKMFHTYVEDLIRFYLNEEPIFKNPPTDRFFHVGKDGQLELDRELLHKTIHDLRKERVVKIVDGRGGDGIYIGPKMTEKEWKAIEDLVAVDITRFISQKFIHPSVIKDGHRTWIIDRRSFSYVSENGITVSGGWGRSNTIDGDGKVNMSKNGTLSLVIHVPDCVESLKQLGKKASP